jgi:Ca2+-binding RTX toxin-like protein
VDIATDVVIEAAGQGTDTVRIGYANPDPINAVSLSLATRYPNVENLAFLGAGRFNVTGTGADNRLTGNASDNVLSGGAGDDTLIGGGGNDTLAGGTGNDSMTGGAGNDTYDVDSLADQVVEDSSVGSGTDTVRVLYGNDSLVVQVIDLATKYPNLENLTLFGTGLFNVTGTGAANQLVGNASANVLDGGNGNDILSGGDGNDTLIGGAGNDTLNGGSGIDSMAGGAGDDVYDLDSASDGVTELAGSGADTVRLRYANPGATAVVIDLATAFPNVESVTLLGTGLFDITGTDAANVLTGNASPNTLIGDGGNDTLNGGGGIDTMAGGTGDDVYDVDTPDDVVTEAADAGNDLVRVGYSNAESTPVAIDLATAFPNVEKLAFLGLGRFDATGTEANNELTGNGSANLLDGGAGNDTLAGGAGDDTLVGGAGDDMLNGGSGNDTMRGGFGNDTYNVDAAGDVTDESGGGGTDTIVSSITFSLAGAGALGIENLTLSGNSAIDGTGSDGANAIKGNSAANRLTGGAGNDFLTGFGGNDTLTGGLGEDRFQFDGTPGPSNIDTIADFDPIEDFIVLDLESLNASIGPVLDASEFHSGAGVTAAADGSDRILYNTTTGALYYDSDGTGSVTAVQFAVLSTKPALDNGDFLLTPV